MIRMLCDICRKPSQCWEFRKKYSIFKRYGVEMQDNFDVCDSCIEEIRIKLKTLPEVK